MQYSTSKRFGLLLGLVLVGASCSGGSSETSADSSSDNTSVEVAETTQATEAEPVESASPASTSTTAQEGEVNGSESLELPEVRVGIPFGLVTMTALGGIDVAEQLDGIAEVSTISITSPNELRTGFAAGDLDVAAMPTNVAANLFNRGVDVRVVGIVDAQLLQFLGPVGTSWDNLAGSTIHLPFEGDVADLLFRQVATARGLDPETDLTFVYGTSLPDLIGAVASGAVTHVVLPEHFATGAALQAKQAGQDIVPVVDLQDEWSKETGGHRLPQMAIVVSGALADEWPEVVQALDLVVAGNVERVESVGEAASVLAEATGMPLPIVEDVLGRLDLDYRSAGAAAADLGLFLDGLLAGSPESIGGSVPGSEFYVE